MRARWAVVLGLLGLAIGPPLAAEASAGGDLIARCVRTADVTSRGIEALRSDCPGIEPAANGLGLERLLPRDWKARISPRALADLSALADRYAAPAPAARPSVVRLQAIALGLKPEPSALSWWARLKAWIKQHLGPALDHTPGWLPHFSIPPRLGRVLVYALVGLILAAAAVVVVLELRAAGVLAPGRQRSRKRRGATADAALPAELRAPAAVDWDALHERPALLLRVLVDALLRARRLERDRELTCRELVARARLDTVTQREGFRQVALLAEQALYGPHRTSVAVPEETLSGARALHAELLAAPATQAAVAS